MNASTLLSPSDAASRLRTGAVLAYPTEAVWGLGCDPFDSAAVQRLLALKERPVDKGLILIAATRTQLEGLLDWDAVPAAWRAQVEASWPGPNTWVVPASPRVPPWIRGAHAGVAVRVSAHPVVVALCEAFGGPLVSTSANPAGAPAPAALEALDAGLRARLDGIVDGVTGGLERPTVIRDAVTGDALRL